MISIRRARPADAPAISRVLIRSIRELCHLDHRGDERVIGRWTANKTPESVACWVTDASHPLFVAERDGTLAGTCAFNHSGLIVLNYVDPTHHRRGVGRAMLDHMEAALARAGVREGSLSSTETAHGFYIAAGWSDAGPAEIAFGIPGYPMRKALPAPPSAQLP